MFGEQVLGMADAQVRRAPNASTDFINGKVKFKKNKTLEWLEGKEDCENVIKFAVKETKLHFSKQKERDTLTALAKKEKQHQMYRKRDTTHRNKLENWHLYHRFREYD